MREFLINFKGAMRSNRPFGDNVKQAKILGALHGIVIGTIAGLGIFVIALS